MPASDHFTKLENMYLSAPINEFFEPEIAIKEGHAEVTVKVKPEFFHAAQALHGAVTFKMLDDAAYFAVSSVVPEVFVLTASFHIYFLRPIASGTIKSFGKIIQQSDRLIIAESFMIDANQRQIARGSGTFMRSKNPLTPELGYA